MYQRSGTRLRSRLRADSRETLRPRGRLRFSSRSLERDRELSESAPELDDSETESESDDSDPDSDSGSEAEETDALDALAQTFVSIKLWKLRRECVSDGKRWGDGRMGIGKDELDEKWIDSTASFVSWLDPSPHSLSASPWLPGSDPQFRSYPKVVRAVRHSYTHTSIVYCTTSIKK